MPRSSALPLLAALLVAAPALAEVASTTAPWQWRDASGHMVYSDTPPPPSVTRIVRAPNRFAGDYRIADNETAAPEAPTGKPAVIKTSAPGKPAPTPEEAFQKRREERLQAVAKEAEQEQIAAARATHCSELRNYAAGLQGGARVARMSADGTMERMDADQRAAAIEQTQASLAQDCS